ncbi:MAG: hypothetical protein R3E68_03420 [Burkholderiaceae bacterium]
MHAEVDPVVFGDRAPQSPLEVQLVIGWRVWGECLADRLGDGFDFAQVLRCEVTLSTKPGRPMSSTVIATPTTTVMRKASDGGRRRSVAIR